MRYNIVEMLIMLATIALILLIIFGVVIVLLELQEQLRREANISEGVVSPFEQVQESVNTSQPPFPPSIE